MDKRIMKWIASNESKLLNGFTRDADDKWNSESEMVDFINMFSHQESLEAVPFILYSKIVLLFANEGLYNKKKFEEFYEHCVRFSDFATLGDYARDVYRYELMDSIDWESWNESFQLTEHK